MRVLVACKFSGIVRDAFAALGHDAWSCDLLPSERPGKHLQADALHAGRYGAWDLLIAHPPCTFLSNSGVRWLYKGGKGSTHNVARWAEMRKAVDFFHALQHAPVEMIAIENPIMHSHASAVLGKPDQIIQPWQFGHGDTKATCLWLKGLPKLVPTNIVDGREARVHRMPPGPDRWKERSRTFTGIAEAMAAQWGAEVARSHSPEGTP